MLRRLADIGRARLRRRAGKPSAPALMTYNVTNRCNARCAMCGIHGWGASQESELTADEFGAFIRDPLLARLEVIRITGGEPFLRTDLPLIYEHAASSTACEIFYVTTNGSFPDRVEAFVKSTAGGSAAIHIQVSLDAMTGEHDRLRGVPGIGERAAGTLRRLSELKNRYDFHAGINQTVMKTTLDQIGPVHEFAESLGLGHSLFLGARFHEGKDLSGERTGEKALEFAPQDGMTPEEMARFYLEHEMLKSNEAAARGRRESRSALMRDLSEEYLNEGGRNRALAGRAKPAPPCMAMFSHFRLLPDGQVAPCSVFRTESAGNVREQPFSEIWRGPRAAEIRKKVLACKGCWIECDINPSVFYSGDIIGWCIRKVVTDSGFRKRYLFARR
ncbi:MAG: radical SAM protein [bacterium]